MSPSASLGFPLRRPVDALGRRRFDLLVIGGGIYGAWIAADAAQRGASVALIEANDWASGTSSASSKLIHGGLRYLEHFEFGLVREALAERRRLAHLAPHLVRPLRFGLPVWRHGRASRLKLAAGLTLYDLLSGFGQPVPRHRRLSRAQLLSEHPQLAADGLLGGFSYGDCQEDDARLALEVVAAAQAAGAICVSHLRAEQILYDRHGRACGAAAVDTLAGVQLEIAAHAVVAAVGPWAPALLGDVAPPMRRIRGVHLVLPALPGPRCGFILSTPQDARAFFLLPWYGRSLLGTTETEVDSAEPGAVTAAEQRYLLEALQARLPGLRWGQAHVIASFAGVRALQPEQAASLSGVTREFELAHPRPRLWVPVGGKYTTARRDAQRVVDAVAGDLALRLAPCRSARLPLPGAPPAEAPGWHAAAVNQLTALGVEPPCAEQLAWRYGRRVDAIAALLREQPELSARIHPQLGFIKAEAALALQQEDVHRPEDLWRRRLPLQLLAESHFRQERLSSLPAIAELDPRRSACTGY